MVVKHLPHAWGLVGIQPYSEARVRDQDILVLYPLSSHWPPFLSWPALSFFLLRGPEQWKKWKSFLALHAKANQPSRTYVFRITRVECCLWNRLGRYLGCQTACSFGSSGQNCLLIMMTVSTTTILISDRMQKKTAYSLAGEMPREMMKHLENK